jgi:tetratricopeptide (TPR) repeat protein
VSQEPANLVAEATADTLSPMASVSSSELMRFQRLLDRTAGMGFKLVMWEAPTAADREAVRAWLAPRLRERSIRIIDVDLVRLFGRTDGHTRRSLNVWSELRRCISPSDVADHRAVLVLSGFEEFISQGERGRSDLLQQFNIQRDILVRDYPCWWLLLIHPASRQQWYNVAPDFSDFAALWIESPMPPIEVATNRLQSLDTLHDRITWGDDQGFSDWPPELRAAHAAVRSSRLDEALDSIYSFRLATTSQPRTDRELAIAHLIEGDVMNLRGKSAQSLEIWRERALATFRRLGLTREQSLAMNRIGDALAKRGNLGEAQHFIRESLAIRERLVQTEPDRADYQRDLSVTHRLLGDLYRALGYVDLARETYLTSLAIVECLTQAEPDRAEYQRDLAIAYGAVGDFYLASCQWKSARKMHLNSLAVSEGLVQREPLRTDYQHVLAVAYGSIGHVHFALDEQDLAHMAHLKSFAIFERLAQFEPERVDYQHDLSVSYDRMGDLYSALGRVQSARDAYSKALRIREHLARTDPDRADYQTGISVSHWRLGFIEQEAGTWHLKQALAILVSLKQSGRLNPVDEPSINQLHELLRQRGFDPS